MYANANNQNSIFMKLILMYSNFIETNYHIWQWVCMYSNFIQIDKPIWVNYFLCIPKTCMLIWNNCFLGILILCGKNKMQLCEQKMPIPSIILTIWKQLGPFEMNSYIFHFSCKQIGQFNFEFLCIQILLKKIFSFKSITFYIF